MEPAEIFRFIAESESIDLARISLETDLYADLGIVGDDFHELIEKFAETYQVNMEKYLWYFHCDEEGWNIGAFFFPPPYDQVERIAITPEVLCAAANNGSWPIEYPEHKLTERRNDLFVNKVLLMVALLGITGMVFRAIFA